MAEDVGCARHILVVDDNPFVATLLRNALAGEGYRVSVVEDGLEALERVSADPPELILLDIELPHLRGDEVCRRLENDPSTRIIPIIMVTAQGEQENKLAAWDYGADEFLSKPFSLAEVLTRCRSLLRLEQLMDERDSAEAVVFALARVVEAKSPYTHGHAERVTRYCLALADEVGVTAGEREILRKGALLHDIGKISVPDAILNKPGPLTPEEFALVQTHSAQGAHIIEPLHSVRDAIPLIRWHHERLDGRGYPDGLSGDDIPLLVRLLSVCDVYDSLSSERPYRRPIARETCVAMLFENARSGGLDLDLVRAFSLLVPGLRRSIEPAAAPSRFAEVVVR
jgi:putative two-component system response regulator